MATMLDIVEKIKCYFFPFDTIDDVNIYLPIGLFKVINIT